MHAMDLMKENGLLFGTSICYTSANYKAVTSDEFMDMLISHGVRFNWYFHYMPSVTVQTLTDAERRAARVYDPPRARDPRLHRRQADFLHRLPERRRVHRRLHCRRPPVCHINPAGDVEPCVFIHYSNANIHDKSLLECLQQPLFKEYHKGQPFNGNHLRPCPMLENPQILGDMVRRSVPTAPICSSRNLRTMFSAAAAPTADQWTPSADRIWPMSTPIALPAPAAPPAHPSKIA